MAPLRWRKPLFTLGLLNPAVPAAATPACRPSCSPGCSCSLAAGGPPAAGVRAAPAALLRLHAPAGGREAASGAGAQHVCRVPDPGPAEQRPGGLQGTETGARSGWKQGCRGEAERHFVCRSMPLNRRSCMPPFCCPAAVTAGAAGVAPREQRGAAGAQIQPAPGAVRRAGRG